MEFIKSNDYDCLALLQHGADSTIRNTDGKTAHDLAEPVAKSVLSGFFIYFLTNIISKYSFSSFFVFKI